MTFLTDLPELLGASDFKEAANIMAAEGFTVVEIASKFQQPRRVVAEAFRLHGVDIAYGDFPPTIPNLPIDQIKATAHLKREDAAKSLGVHPTTVTKWRRAAGILPSTVSIGREAVEAVSHLPDYEASAILRVSKATVKGLCHLHGIAPAPDRRTTGVSDAEIVDMVNSGVSQAETAKRLGIAVGTVHIKVKKYRRAA